MESQIKCFGFFLNEFPFCIFVCIVHVQERVRAPQAVSRHCSRQLSHTLTLVPSHRYTPQHTCLAQLHNGKQQAVAGH